MGGGLNLVWPIGRVDREILSNRPFYGQQVHQEIIRNWCSQAAITSSAQRHMLLHHLHVMSCAKDCSISQLFFASYGAEKA
jgi:hypothetical protein